MIKTPIFAFLLMMSFFVKAQVLISHQSLVTGHHVHWGWFSGPVIGLPTVGVGCGFPVLPYWEPFWPVSYAAISYSPSKNYYGWAWGKNSSKLAFNSARASCISADCIDLVWVLNGCAAAASLSNGDHLGWAYHAYKNVAIEYALRACNSSLSKGNVTNAPGNQSCEVQAWVCSF